MQTLTSEFDLSYFIVYQFKAKDRKSKVDHYCKNHDSNTVLYQLSQETDKGGLISESFSLRLKSPKKKVPNHSPEHILFRWIGQGNLIGAGREGSRFFFQICQYLR